MSLLVKVITTISLANMHGQPAIPLKIEQNLFIAFLPNYANQGLGWKPF